MSSERRIINSNKKNKVFYRNQIKDSQRQTSRSALDSKTEFFESRIN